MQSLTRIRLRKILVVAAVLGFCAAFPVYLRIPQECVLCRAERNEYHLFGGTFSGGIRDNGEFTRWYVAHRPSHEHLWGCSSAGCVADRHFFGLPVTLHMMGGSPILHICTSNELQFVEHSEETALSQFFADAASTNIEAQLRAADTARKKLSEMR